MKLSKAAFQFNPGLKYKMKLLRVLLLCTLTFFVGFDIFSQSIVDTTYLEFSRKYQDYEEFRKYYPGNSRIQFNNGFLEFYDKEKGKNRRLKVEGLKEDVNIISRIPLNKGFVAFKEVETASRWLYFISNDGRIIKELEINMYPAIRFSEKGNFVVLYNLFGKRFSIFDTQGNEIYSCQNYQDLIGSKTHPLNHVNVDAEGNFLLHSDKIYYFSKEGKLLWTAPSGHIFSSSFFSDKCIVAVESFNPLPPSHALKLFSLENGELLLSEKGNRAVFFHDNKIIIQKGNIYEEYKLH